MDLELRGKTAVVTGGSKGIGYATAMQFLQEGARVAICARNKAELKDAAEQLSSYGEVYAEAVDMTCNHEVELFAAHTAQRFGKLDCWVNNVGAVVVRKGEAYTTAEISQTTEICFHSVVYGCQNAFHYMKHTGGSIVNISSLAARCATAGRSTLYGPLKTAVIGLSTSFAGEYAAYGVRVNAVLPGFTLTPAVADTISPQELARNAEETLLRRPATPEEIARPVVFLCSEMASYITAASLEISGGRSVVLNPAYSYERKAAEQPAISSGLHNAANLSFG